jgi:hypothetical protein
MRDLTVCDALFGGIFAKVRRVINFVSVACLYSAYFRQLARLLLTLLMTGLNRKGIKIGCLRVIRSN